MNHVFLQPSVPITVIYHFRDSRNPGYLIPPIGIFNRRLKLSSKDPPPESVQPYWEGWSQISWKLVTSFQWKGEAVYPQYKLPFLLQIIDLIDFGYSLQNYRTFFQQNTIQHDKWFRLIPTDMEISLQHTGEQKSIL